MQRELWRPAPAQATVEMPWLRPLIILLYASAAIGVLFQYWLVPILNLAGTGVSFWTGFRRLAIGWVEAGSTIALLWTLWEANGYLQRRAQGVPWAVATKTFLRRTGLYLLVAALWADLIAPTFAAQLEGGGWFAWQASPPMLALAGLGLVFMSMARNLGDQSQRKWFHDLIKEWLLATASRRFTLLGVRSRGVQREVG